LYLHNYEEITSHSEISPLSIAHRNARVIAPDAKVVTLAFIKILGFSGAPCSILGSGFLSLWTPKGRVIKKINHHEIRKKITVVALSISYADC
tara:strand:- start:810 stop:1088 length:279 start_codon:yes stop_codon:yes gene_type:complete